jgi:EAL domain-containing protein (putative c-di-GMP-specific phosphodiesterase class I)
MNCDYCRSITPIEDKGTVLVRPVLSAANVIELPYHSKEELLDLLMNSRENFRLLSAHPEELEMTILCEGSIRFGKCCNGWLPLSVWLSRLENYDLVDIIHRNQFTSYMQPILQAGTGVVYGYEFLLRPVENGIHFAPSQLFQVAQETGFHSFLDRAARHSAIQVGAKHLPAGIKRFVNFLPSSIYDPRSCLVHTLNSIQQLKQDPSDFVFEVVETEEIADIGHLSSIFSVYKQNGAKVALDDVGSGHSTLDVLIRLKPDYVKIDRSLVSFIDERPEQRKELERIVEISRSLGATVLAEGLERPEEYEVCKEAGVSLVQGYMFGKPDSKPLGGKPAA